MWILFSGYYHFGFNGHFLGGPTLASLPWFYCPFFSNANLWWLDYCTVFLQARCPSCRPANGIKTRFRQFLAGPSQRESLTERILSSSNIGLLKEGIYASTVQHSTLWLSEAREMGCLHVLLCTADSVCVLNCDLFVHAAEKHVYGSDVSSDECQRNQLLFSKLHSLLHGIVKLVPMWADWRMYFCVVVSLHTQPVQQPVLTTVSAWIVLQSLVSVRPFISTLLNQLTFDLRCLYVYGSWHNLTGDWQSRS